MIPPRFLWALRAVCLMAPMVLPGVPIRGQQVADTAFRPELGKSSFAPGAGPLVVLDEAHFNFHTLDGRYRIFARVLRHDGFVVEASSSPFSAASLEGVDVLVIANALNRRNQSPADWRLPTPGAFTAAEVEAVRAWVEGGGSLLLIADHMPFPGAAAELAAAFGFELMNGFAVQTEARTPIVFRRSDGSLADNAALGGGPSTNVDSVVSFTGEAFKAPPGATSLLTLPAGVVSLNPRTAWQFADDTPRVDVGGWSQGAVVDFGRGRVAVFGEAAMFTAQLAGAEGLPMGMNAPGAGGNPQFLINLVRWLARVGTSTEAGR